MAQKRKSEDGSLKVTIELDNETNAVVEALAKSEHMDKKWFIAKLIENHVKSLKEASSTEQSA